jgi:hypothetical protein
MAIDSSVLKLLLWSKNLGVKFDRTATLGRMGFPCSPGQVQKDFDEFGFSVSREKFEQCFAREVFQDVYADGLIRALGASDYVSIDRSNFEGATFIHDLNDPFPEAMRNRFDFVLDGGTLEHVFNFPAALRHSMELVRVGGHFMTVPPANGQMGHGFYQVSPELYFSALSPQNGFVIRKIVIYECYQSETRFYEVQSPTRIGGRVELGSSPPATLAVLAQRISDASIFAQPPQQSDYVAAWKEVEDTPKPVEQTGTGHRLRLALNPYIPHWVRRVKRKFKLEIFAKHDPPGLANTRFFRPLTNAEITSERQK